MNAAAQSISNKGKEFWAGFGHHVDMEPAIPLTVPEMILYFSAEENATVTVTVEGTAYKKVYSIPAGGVIASDLMPRGLTGNPSSDVDTRLYSKDVTYGGTNSQGIFTKKGIHITSDVPIVAYAHIYEGSSSAATMLLPVEAWGYSYTALTATQTAWKFTNDRFSWMYIVASQNDTKVRITPSVKLRNGSPANVPIDVTLQKGDIYQLMGGFADSLHIFDLNGTTVLSLANSSGTCVPAGVFLGSSGCHLQCGSFPGNWPTEENLMQQAFPEHAWGKRYLTVPTSIDTAPKQHNPNLFRIMVKDRNTVVKRNGVTLTGITTQGYYDFWSSTADYVEANQPVQVLQMMPSQGCCGYQGSGDPEMTYISPIEQGITRAGFYRNDKVYIDWNFLALTIPTKGLETLTIDGTRNFTHTYPHPNLAGYSVVVHRWRTTAPPRAPSQSVVKSDSAFTAVTYGIGQAESYAYNAGTYVNNLNGIAFIKNEYNTGDTASVFTCANTPVHLSVLMRYKPDKLTWKMSQLAGKVTPATDVVITAPVVKEEVVVKGVTYYRYELPGAYTFTVAGTYIVPLYSTQATVPNCDNTEKIQYEIVVKPAVQAAFSIVYDNCKASELITFTGDTLFNNGGRVQNWIWKFTGNAVNINATGQQVQQLFNAGDYQARMIGVDSNGCSVDTVKGFRLSTRPPTPAFSAVDGTNCEGALVRFTENVQDAGAKSWYWQIDGKDTLLTANGYRVDKVTGGYDTITVKHVVKYSATCESDTATGQVIIYAKPAVTFTTPSGCVPGDGMVYFTAASTVADGQGASAYYWSFDDTLATAANPNTSLLQSPSHKYASGGSYNVELKVTSQQGCVSDTVVALQLYLYPVVAYDASSVNVCQGPTPVSIATGTVTNNVAGTGYYKGIDISAPGMLTPLTQGTIRAWFIYTTTAGCTDSAYSDIVVKPSPQAIFDVTPQICKGDQASITDASTVSAGRIRTWKWSFGEGSTAQYTTNDPFDWTYNIPGSYTIKLVVVAASGCTDSVTHIVEVGAKPTPGFTLPAAVCLPGGEAVFANTTSVAAGAAVNYAWYFGDGATATDVTGRHVYAAAGSYTVKLVATSAGICKDSIQKTVASFYNKPVASFTINPVNICQSETVQWTNATTVAGSTIQAYAWDFGDGGKDSVRIPAKKYTKTGLFTITLNATSKEGCVSDPLQKQVQVFLQPVIDAGPDIAAQEQTTVQLQATANSNGLQFAWTPAAMVSNATILRPSVYLTDDVVLTLTATGDNNCTASDQVKILVQRPLVIPNIFTPNGDGINDTWIVKNLDLYPHASLQIFSRYGQKVFEASGLIKPWDGFSNGAPVQAGVYYYVIRLHNGDGPLSGSVTIIR
ncbi:PKD domain-containing protein [Filimonas lacunae]|nr:PKD domain-containing protein [Filimonas lacunae]BAV09118.1 Muc19 precursor [Filimonas lacunae]